MTQVNITINGQKITAKAGQTVLQAARAAGIDIPVLCEHPALSAWGACRICLVEIKHQRGLQPACTFPVSEGLEIWTESESVVKSRKFVLELLFSERNHFCMYCQMSGDCELQDLAYRYQLDHWTYNRAYQPMALDATRHYFIMEPNRCILCRRCVRACSEVVANHTLGVKERGANSMIIADHDVPFGQSSCVECGTCLQVCPTGALIDRRSAYGYRNKHDVIKTRTTCMQCSAGCAIDVVTKDNRILRVDGVWGEGPSNGLLCVDGRFKPLYDTRPRVTSPMVRRNGKLEAVEWEEALQLVADKLKGSRPFGVASTAGTNEAFMAFADLFKRTGGVAGRAEAALPAIGMRPGVLEDLLSADFIIVTGVDPLARNRVAGYFIKRALDKGARLALVGKVENGLAAYATMQVDADRAGEVVSIAQKAAKPVVVYGTALSPAVAQSLVPLADVALSIGLDGTQNGPGALAAGLVPVAPQKAGVIFLLAGDASQTELLASYLNGAFTIVQASRHSALTDRADVVLPSPIWAEQAGTMTNLEGVTRPLHAAVAMPAGVRSDVEVLHTLAGMI